MITDLSINILAATICFTFGLAWKSILTPFFHELLYRGIRIEGKWEILPNQLTCDGTELKVVRSTIVNLNQKGFKVEGNATSIAIVDGKNDMIHYRVKGEIKDRIVSITFYNTDNTRLAYSLFLLEVTSSGQTIQGYRVFYALIASKINSVSCIWKKVV